MPDASYKNGFKNSRSHLPHHQLSIPVRFYIILFCSSVSHLSTELHEAVESYKTKAETYMGKLEAAEIARSKAARAEAFGTFQSLIT
jgi:hypothetical protein